MQNPYQSSSFGAASLAYSASSTGNQQAPQNPQLRQPNFKPIPFGDDTRQGGIQKITRISELPNVIYDNVELDQDVIISQSEQSQPQIEEIQGGGDPYDYPSANQASLEQQLSLLL